MSCNEKYPIKRAYAIGKLYKFLKEKGIYKEFSNECKMQYANKGNKTIDCSIAWYQTINGHDYWSKINREFEHYKQGVDVDKT